MRVFLFGGHPHEILPQFPLPTHNVILRRHVPTEFEPCLVALDENADRYVLKDELRLCNAISELPKVTNNEPREEMPYGEGPRNEFQQYIRLSRREILDHSFGNDEQQECKLLDHQPDLKGVKVGPDNVCYLDPQISRPLLPSGKPLVPKYAISHLKGKSLKCFGLLWWDETVPTMVTRAQPHNQIILHPEQDRVLTIRENARLQGFPDYYKFSGPIEERYKQVGNAVAVPVGRALGYGLGQAFLRIKSDGHVFTLPSHFFLVGQHPQTEEGEVLI
ncbi:DNA (cytosine-5-)-methyltransferase family protein [Rhynchospora pubera]|uniref:DNA (cytosine-5-)-methyltransferase n=1 Tax=Rhynchospora pubera TaxID=906938 RepID=A0AAV8CHT9_9POAL|nr:DNA (cytosine-5-)-methyltransferase family protein [Rhynchospora pubera]